MPSIIVTGKVQDIGFRSVVEHIGRKLDTRNEFLKNLPDIKNMFGSFIGEQREHNIGQREYNKHLEAMMYEQNARLDAHNTRLEAILEKLVNKS